MDDPWHSRILCLLVHWKTGILISFVAMCRPWGGAWEKLGGSNFRSSPFDRRPSNPPRSHHLPATPHHHLKHSPPISSQPPTTLLYLIHHKHPGHEGHRRNSPKVLEEGH